MSKWLKEDFTSDVKCKRIVTETETIPGDKSKQLADDIIVHAYVTHFSEHQNLKTDPFQWDREREAGKVSNSTKDD